MFTLEDTAWIRSRIFFKDFINFVSLLKAVIFAIFYQFKSKHDVGHLQYMLYPSAVDNNAPMYALGDTAWTRD